MRKAENLTGRKFGRLTVIKREEYSGHDTKWLCKCDCGNEHAVVRNQLITGHTKSCGCLKKEIMSETKSTHKMTSTRIYRIYNAMKQRCYYSKSIEYDRYGGRGITVCEEWLNSFETFYKWAMANGYSENLTIDRINIDSNYSPENCRWVTMAEQNNNKSNNRVITYNGKTQNLSQWARELGTKRETLKSRLNRGWSIERTLSTP